LGLYVTMKIATELLNGGISVESREGEGSTFTLTVPSELEVDAGVPHTVVEGG